MHTLLSRLTGHYAVPSLVICVALLGSPAAIRAGCSSVGCGRIDWTEAITTADEQPAVEFHGAFTWANAMTEWVPFRDQVHFIAQCAVPDPACEDQLEALRGAAEMQTPVLYNPDDFGKWPTFLANEGKTPEVILTDNVELLKVSPGSADKSNCPVAFALPRNAPACAGDCDGNGAVTIDEIILGVAMAIESRAADACTVMDVSGDGVITVDEVVGAMNHALQGCP